MLRLVLPFKIVVDRCGHPFLLYSVRLESIQSELEREQKLRKDLEGQLKAAEATNDNHKVTQEHLKTQIHAKISELVSCTVYTHSIGTVKCYCIYP